MLRSRREPKPGASASTPKTPTTTKPDTTDTTKPKILSPPKTKTPETPKSANVSTRAASKKAAEVEAMEPKPCPGITIVYSCGHSWIEHVRDCNTKVISACPSNITSQPKFACIMCGPPGSGNVTADTILKAKTLGSEFEYWLKGLMKDKNGALEQIEADKVEVSKLNEEIMKLQETLEKEKEGCREKGAMIEDLKKQVEEVISTNKAVATAPAVMAPPPPAQVSSSYPQTQIQPNGGIVSPAVLDGIVVVEMYEGCGHQIELLGATQSGEKERTEAVILKNDCCPKCLKFITSSEKEKIFTVEKQLDGNFDKFLDGFNSQFTANWDEDRSTNRAKGIVEKFFRGPVDGIVEEMKDSYQGLVDWQYGVQVLDNVAAMELALRQGDERRFVLKKNELWEARRGYEEALRECADTFEVKVLSACKGSVEEWIKEKEDRHSVTSAETEDVQMA